MLTNKKQIFYITTSVYIQFFQELNELGDKQNWPLIIKKGRIEDMSIKVPWTKNTEVDSLLMVNGLSLTVQPKTREEPGSAHNHNSNSSHPSF